MASAPANSDLLAEGITAARRGERAKARDLFTRLLRHDQRIEEAWLWMSAVVESDRERVFCLNNVVKLNPAGKTAKRGLALLGALPPDMRGDLDIDVVGVTLQARARPQSQRRGLAFRRSRRLENLVIAALALIVLVVVGLVAVNNFKERQRLASIVPPTSAPPTATHTPTRTQVPTRTPFVTAAPVVGAGLTPLAVKLGVSFTATPEPFTLPFFPEESYSRGESAYRSGDMAQAISLLKEALAQNPANYPAHYLLGEAYLQQMDYNKASGAFASALRINPGFAPAALGRGQANFGLGGNPLLDYDKAAALAPQWVEPYIQRAIFYSSRRNTSAAIRELEAGQMLAPKNVVVLWRLAEQYANAGWWDDAIATVDLALSVDPTALDVYRVKASVDMAAGRYAGALESLDLYLTYRPGDAEAWTTSGLAHLGQGNTLAALTSLNRAIDLKPDDPREALIARGRAELILGNPDLAGKDFDAALALGVATRYWLQIGQAHYFVGDYPSAAVQFQKAVNGDPTQFDAQYWLGAA
nr:tetratricopeptide repeat protein [Chloroflexota bacterium]